MTLSWAHKQLAYPVHKDFSMCKLRNTVHTMMTSTNGNISALPLWGESTGRRWIPLTKAGDAELWGFRWYAPEQTVEQTIETTVIWGTIALIMTSL